jgi:hypothetical protein
MKKLLLLAFVLCLSCLKGYAAGNYNLQFTDSLVTDNDTCYVGASYRLYVYIKNDGPDSFNGDIAFKVYVARKNDLNLSKPQTTFVLDSGGANTYHLAPHSRTLYSKDIIINDKDFHPDTTNIIIVWPSGSVKPTSGVIKDNYVTDNFCDPYQKVYVSSKKRASFVSGRSSGTPANLSFFPNPSISKITVKLKLAYKGSLRVVDLNGKVVCDIAVTPDVHSYDIGLTRQGELLPEGIYILSYQTTDGIENKKIIISR